MLKFLIFFILLVGSSLFVADVFSVEVELKKKNDWIIESMGWLTPEKASMQEQFKLIIDQSKHSPLNLPVLLRKLIEAVSL